MGYPRSVHAAKKKKKKKSTYAAALLLLFGGLFTEKWRSESVCRYICMEARKVDEELSARARGGRLMLVKEHAPMMSAVPRRKRSALDTLSFYNEREVGEGMFRMLDG